MSYDIQKHNIIEASAGSGKTHTIKNIVLDILLKTNTELSEILVVTFTEKATGELKDRIRQTIADEIPKVINTNLKEKLTDCINNFDSASIFTIHGFCNKILKDYSFENKQNFENEIIKDIIVYKKSLNKLKREKWKNLYKENLFEILEISNYPDLSSKKSRWEELVIDIAMKYKKDDIILPQKMDDFLEYFNNLVKNIQQKHDEIVNFLGRIDTDNIKNSDFYLKYDNFTNNIKNKNTINDKSSRLNKIILPILKIINKFQNEQISLTKNYIEFIYGLASWKVFSENGFNCLVNYRGKEQPEVYEVCPFIDDLICLLTDIKNLIEEKNIKHQLLVQTVSDLKEEARIFKRENSFISFDDMLTQVEESLTDNDLVDKLRVKYKYGIVDEFQDTDSIQWNIFKKVFLESKTNKLLIIGDPKQAIYAFRGADVNTYFIAKNEMEKNNANPVNLPFNWRSTKQLIDIYNLIFNNWFSTKDEIKYIDTRYPDGNEDDRPKLISSDTTFNSLGVINLGESLASDAKFSSAKIISQEIKKLLNSNIKIRIKKEERYLKASDICILIRTGRDGKIIEKELTLQNIPFSFYKKAGLYQTDEAKHIYYLLNSIANPKDRESFFKALLTRFFEIDIDKIENYENISVDSEVKKLFLKWDYFSEKKQFSRLFQSIMEETGILYRDIKEIDGERRITNYYHILQNLENEAQKNNLDILDIVDILKSYINTNVLVEEILDLQRLETEEDKVKIITIHSSKGLEFPVVFIFGGFSKGNPKSYFKFHNAEKKLVYDLTKDDANKIIFNEEEENEEKRLFYVAITRAIFKLYIPYFEPKIKNKLGPLGTFIKNIIEETFFQENNPNVEIIKCGENLQTILQKNILKEDIVKNEDILLPERLFVEVDKSIRDKKIEILSFSSIKKEEGQKETYGNFAQKEEDTGGDEEVEKDTLPSGNRVGSMFHSILENIDFCLASQITENTSDKKFETIYSLIDKNFNDYILKYSKNLSDEKIKIYKNKILEIILNTLNTPIDKDGFKLSMLKNEDKLHEVQFYYPITQTKDIKIEEVNYKEGFLTGFIDMIFKKENKYYILDWKSNKYLTYQGENFSNRVKKEYGLQYELYSIALIRYLKSVLPDFDYDKHFGGIYYIYLRGKDVSDFTKGVFFERIDKNPIYDYEQKLFDI
ncbi:MAG: hypothetical protein A2Y34_15795 [Spirochaetes bacterium GWC1_27_15]|nr:MAG: hypothetical protein A2Y34_15795 [Spirochaetes bacterium GWC1_27_15]